MSIYEANATDSATASIPIGIQFPEARWDVRFWVFRRSAISGNTKSVLSSGAGFTSNYNWRIRAANTFQIQISIEGGSGGTHTHPSAVPADQWVEIHCYYESGTSYIGYDGVYDTQATSYPASSGFDQFNLLAGSAAVDEFQIGDIRIEENNGALKWRYLCDEGSGTVWTDSESQGHNGTLSSAGIHATPEPGYPGGEIGPPTTVTFGPVSTNDDPSVTEWNWEASADGGTNWDEAENVLSDVSGEATTSLVVNSATIAEDQTQVRCRAISANEPGGVTSSVATLTVQAAS